MTTPNTLSARDQSAQRSAPAPLSKPALIASWLAQLVVAGVLAQTLFFKFTAAPESVYIFEKLGAEPVGRIGSGVMELIAAVLLLIPRTAVVGAGLAAGIILGAIGAHLGPLGIVVQNDGGLLFALALIVFFGALTILALRRHQARVLIARALALVRGK
ncbi:MAG: DoxX family protein [Planctomycetota bacterium]|nr:DoxX family protein [Planctomycetota bacterium]